MTVGSSRRSVSLSCLGVDRIMPNAGLEKIYANFGSNSKDLITNIGNESDLKSKQAIDVIKYKSNLKTNLPTDGCSPVLNSSKLSLIKSDMQRKSNRVYSTGISAHYSRIQIPSTKAASRAKGFTMTDSLKLYEEQIFSHYEANQRPQSWCMDFADEANDDRVSDGSPASTVCSSFSSSSSDSSHLVPLRSSPNRYKPSDHSYQSELC